MDIIIHFVYNYYKYILLDYGLSLKFGTYKLINIFLQVYSN